MSYGEIDSQIKYHYSLLLAKAFICTIRLTQALNNLSKFKRKENGSLAVTQTLKLRILPTKTTNL